MDSAPYHHGNLRAALLDAAARTLRDHGVDQISLRELARQTGVSKSAPNRHFRDRQALLAALAVGGFERLDAALRTAVAQAGGDYRDQLRAAAAAFVDFAVSDGALLELMFSLAKTPGRDDVAAAADGMLVALGEVIGRGQASGRLRAADPARLNLLMAAMFQGIASLVSTGRIPAAGTAELIDDAVDLFVAQEE